MMWQLAFINNKLLEQAVVFVIIFLDFFVNFVWRKMHIICICFTCTYVQWSKYWTRTEINTIYLLGNTRCVLPSGQWGKQVSPIFHCLLYWTNPHCPVCVRFLYLPTIQKQNIDIQSGLTELTNRRTILLYSVSSELAVLCCVQSTKKHSLINNVWHPLQQWYVQKSVLHV